MAIPDSKNQKPRGPICVATCPSIQDGTSQRNLAPRKGPAGGQRSGEPASLKDIPGIKVAWNWEGHGVISKEAVKATKEASIGLPQELQELIKWMAIPQHVQCRDIEDVFFLGHWTKAGQKHHFMRHASQSEQEAFDLARKWIFDNAIQAAMLVKIFMKRKFLRNPDMLDWAGWYLGNALHALQDSFAPGHVERGPSLVILKINVYDEENKSPSQPGKQGHSKLDEAWQDKKDPSGLSELGKAARVASTELIQCSLLSGLAANPHAHFQTLARKRLEEPYLTPSPALPAFVPVK